MKLKNPVCLMIAVVMLCCAVSACAEGLTFQPLTASLSFWAQAMIPEGAAVSEAELMQEAVEVMTRRLEALGYSDFSLRAEGTIVYGDVNNMEDRNLMDILLWPGRISFIDLTGREFMTGDMIQDASYCFFEDEWGHTVILRLTEEGARLWANATAMSIGSRIRIMMDDEVLLEVMVQGVDTDGECELSGIESLEKARMITAVMQSGPMPVGFDTGAPDWVDESIPVIEGIEMHTERPDESILVIDGIEIQIEQPDDESSDPWAWLKEIEDVEIVVMEGQSE